MMIKNKNNIKNVYQMPFELFKLSSSSHDFRGTETKFFTSQSWQVRVNPLPDAVFDRTRPIGLG